MTEGPFTDEMIRGYLMAAKTQQSVIKCAEAMAQVMAEAGRASAKATGDSPHAAIRKWLRVIEARAFELLREDGQRKLEAPTIEVEK